MKVKLTFLILLVCCLFAKAQVTYFPTTANSWVEGKDRNARLYSVEIRRGQTLVTIELVPKKNIGHMKYWTSRNTIVQAANGKIELPILGFLRTENGETFYHTQPFSGDWGWSKAEKGRSYKYTMVFDGIIPPGITDFALRDRGTYDGAHGYQFWNYTLNNPPIGQTNYNTETLIKQCIDATPNDPFVGIYEGFSGNRYKLACIKEDGKYYLLYMSDKEHLPWWKIGDIKAQLNNSATPGFFKVDWLMANKSYNDNAYVMFERGTMKTVIDNDEDNYLKMYPDASSSSSSYNSGGGSYNEQQWSGSGFALTNGYIATNYHVIDEAKTIYVQGIKGDFSIKYKAEVIASDKFNDLALLKITDSRFTGFGSIPYCVSTATAAVGEEIFVLGYPLTTTMGDEIKLTTGVISSKTGFQGDVSLYQISAPIQPGNSGGPLFDSKGNIIGIVNAKHSGAENVGYAIKASYLRNLIESVTTTNILPNSNSVSSLPLTGKVSAERNFVFMISCSNQANNNDTFYNNGSYPNVTQSNGNIVVTNPTVRSTTASRTHIKNITISDTETKIEFEGNNNSMTGYYTWVTILPDSYIVVNGQRYRMKRAEGIGVSPAKTYFNNPNTNYNFTLYFPAIPKTATTLDFIESDDSEWKFYGVRLK